MEGVEVVCRHALAALHAASHAVLAKCVLDPTSPPGFASAARWVTGGGRAGVEAADTHAAPRLLRDSVWRQSVWTMWSSIDEWRGVAAVLSAAGALQWLLPHPG
eukprot:1180023-Rhodomonas_salina.4